MGALFLSEVVGTAMLLLLGGGVVANTALTKTKGNGTGFLFVNFGWGLAVFAGVLVSQKSGAHLNPAVTLGIASRDLVAGTAVDWGKVFIYIIAQMIGAFIGAVLCWLAYKDHFDQEPNAATKLGVFSTGPAIRSTTWNLVTEAIATFVLVFVILAAGLIKSVDLGWLGALGVALLVVGIGASLGGPTGYAINPARDLGPRIAHAVLPIKGKGDSDWAYSWVPVVGPIIGGVLAGLLVAVLIPA
ncbi:MAG TPA: MIP/aquaporin family protein [Propionicimonas sp.]|nr:MIP/aquaporin family protein [Propionicimonas sp.]